MYTCFHISSQFRQQLVEIGFASRGPPPPPEELYKVDVALLQCVLTCGLYPQVGASILLFGFCPSSIVNQS